jgi:uncharacterized protein YjiS (DUF1127 family)
MTLQIRDIAPHLEVETIECPVRFHNWIDYRGLRSDQRQKVTQHVIRHAQAARAQASHDLGGAGMRTLQAAAAIIRALAKALIAAAGKWWRAHTIRRARIAAIRELHALDDRTLRDIGVSRILLGHSRIFQSNGTEASGRPVYFEGFAYTVPEAA